MPSTDHATHPSLRFRSARRAAFVTAVATLSAVLASCAPGNENDVGTSVEESVCATGATVEGVDVSVYQGSHIDWNMVHASGRQFAITRINDGTNSLDPTFRINWSGIRAAGMIRGAYQFFRPNEDPNVQARIVCDAIGTLGAGDLPAMLDLEVSGGMSPSTIVSRITTWLHAVESCTGKRPMIYTAGWFWNPSVDSRSFGTYPLAVAAYGPSCPTLPIGWTNWAVFQYSDGDTRYTPGVGPVPGIGQSVDRDKFNGSLSDLRAFAGDVPDWGARYVAQSFPLASDGTVRVHAGQSVSAWIELRNIGGHAWNSNTRLATTMPRDRVSHFAGRDWVANNRPDQVSGTIAPGASYRFQFTFNPPATMAPGLYHEHFGMVQEGVSWFSAPGELGPADSQIEAVVEVLPPLVTDAGTHTADAAVDASSGDAHAPDAGTDASGATDASHAGAADAHEAGVADGGDAGEGDGGDGGHVGGTALGGCSVSHRIRGRSDGALLAIGFAAAMLAVRRRRSAR